MKLRLERRHPRDHHAVQRGPARRPRLPGRARALAGRRRLHRHRPPRLAGRGRDADRGEKRQVLETCVRAVGDRVPVVPGIAALSTAEAVALAQDAQQIGCAGLMVLPPYVYSTDWREMKAHVAAVLDATDLPCMLYNNPVAYRTDFTPEQIAELAAALPEPARRQGVEHRRAARHRHPRAPGRPPGDAGRRRRRDRRRRRRGRGRLDRGAGQRLPGRVGGAVPATRWKDAARRRTRSTAGSCRCCAWTPCRSSCSSSSWCRSRSGRAARACGRRGCAGRRGARGARWP